jgi:hypothetical protein
MEGADLVGSGGDEGFFHGQRVSSNGDRSVLDVHF